jgi:hypothetical protein
VAFWDDVSCLQSLKLQILIFCHTQQCDQTYFQIQGCTLCKQQIWLLTPSAQEWLDDFICNENGINENSFNTSLDVCFIAIIRLSLTARPKKFDNLDERVFSCAISGHILEHKAVFHNVCLNTVWTQVRAIRS